MATIDPAWPPVVFVDGVPVARGRELRALLVLALLASDHALTVSQLVAAVERGGFTFAGRAGKEVSDALRLPALGRGRRAPPAGSTSERQRSPAAVPTPGYRSGRGRSDVNRAGVRPGRGGGAPETVGDTVRRCTGDVVTTEVL